MLFSYTSAAPGMPLFYQSDHCDAGQRKLVVRQALLTLGGDAPPGLTIGTAGLSIGHTAPAGAVEAF